ncbi:hypothetical protein [Ekhidna sp.]
MDSKFYVPNGQGENYNIFGYWSLNEMNQKGRMFILMETLESEYIVTNIT